MIATAAPTLTFDSATHTYTLDGVVLPSVTQILKAAGLIDYSMIPQDVLQFASQRGTAVHRAIEFWLDGDLDERTIDPRIAGYVIAAKNFLQDASVTVHRSECRVHHIAGYAGTFDVEGSIASQPTLIDWKTGIKLPGHALQLAAYVNCMDKPRTYRQMAVYLRENGTYDPWEIPRNNFQQDVQVFMSAFACTNWKQKKGVR